MTNDDSSLKYIVESSTHGIIVLSGDRKVQTWNRWVSEYSKIDAQNAIGQSFDSIFKKTLNPRLIKAIDLAIDAGKATVLSHSFHPHHFPFYKSSISNELMHQKVTVQGSRDSQNNRFCVIEITDYTAGLERENAIKQVRSHLDQVLASVQDILIVINEKFELCSANPVFYSTLNISSGQISNIQFKNLFYTPEDLLKFEGALKTSPNLFKNLELSFMSGDKSELQVLLNCSKLQIGEHEVNYVITVKDITAQRKDERLIVEQAQQLALSNRLAAIGEVAGGIAHEINNPVAIIDGATALLTTLLNQENLVQKEKILKKITLIQSTTDRIANIIKGMKQLCGNETIVEFSLVNLNDLVVNVLAVCSQKFRDNRIQIKALPDFRLLQVECNPVQISQVLLNLFVNAADAIKPLGERWIEIAIALTDKTVTLSVIDSGNGIPKAVADKMFVPFFTTKEVGHGTGLGMGICKTIIEHHQGTIFIDGNCKNTKVSFTIPLVQPQSQENGNANHA